MGSPSQNFHTSMLFKILIHSSVFIISMYLKLVANFRSFCRVAVVLFLSASPVEPVCGASARQKVSHGTCSLAHSSCLLCYLRFIIMSKFSVCRARVFGYSETTGWTTTASSDVDTNEPFSILGSHVQGVAERTLSQKVLVLVKEVIGNELVLKCSHNAQCDGWMSGF